MVTGQTVASFFGVAGRPDHNSHLERRPSIERVATLERSRLELEAQLTRPEPGVIKLQGRGSAGARYLALSGSQKLSG
jgi:hypothetical protein